MLHAFLHRLVFAGVVLAVCVPSLLRGAERPHLDLERFFSVRRVADVQVSPDGMLVVFTVSVADLKENRLERQVWVLGPRGAARQLAQLPEGAGSPCWSPDSRQLAFVAPHEGVPQIWRAPLDGGEAVRVTNLSTGASSPQWSPQGDTIGFLSSVWPDVDGGDDAQRKRQEEREASGIAAEVYEDLLYRHWDSFRRGKRMHLLVTPADGGTPRDLTPGDSDVLGGSRGFAFSPDGRRVAFARSPVDPRTGSGANVEAWSTNADLWIVSVAPDSGAPRCVTRSNRGWDGVPTWSPDGRTIAFCSQEREGYESDRRRLALLDVGSGEVRFDVASALDRSVDEILWSPDSSGVLLGVEEEGRRAVYALQLAGLRAEGSPRPVLRGRTFGRLSAPTSMKFVVGTIETLSRPAEIAALEGPLDLTAPPRLVTLSSINRELLDGLRPPVCESVTYRGALDQDIQAWLLRPPGATSLTPRPFVLFIHGGPQGAWLDSFHFRWNLSVFASAGFVVMAPNPHGSTGFGQAFTEQISGDWAGACYEDLMRGVDWAVEQGIADPDRMAAMGGSFGGYMVNWILGHSDRFRALISHAGVYNLESMYGATEELWFPEWDLRGTPWDNTGCYEAFSPHRFAERFKTPTLVVHGQLDYRVPVTEGMQLFTALRRQGVEARFLYYPDEGHWVQKPRNSRLWYETCLGWLDRHLRPSP